jgi:hypothetical protein
MNERLVEDWLAKASERSYQTPFAQALMAERMQILRIGHSSHEHGKDIIALDAKNRVHAYQLKDGDLDLQDFEKGLGQLTALVETPVEHPGIKGKPSHQPWLVISGKTSIPVEDRIRLHNIGWKKRGYRPLRTINGSELIGRFSKMTENFWPQMPEDSRRLFNLFLADGKHCLDRDAFSKLISSVTATGDKAPKTEIIRRMAAANLFASYALSPFYTSKNHWEIIQGWTMTAAQIAWEAEKAKLPPKVWRPTFQRAIDEALVSLDSLANEALQPDALHPRGFELDELTKSRCTICAAGIAAKVLVAHHRSQQWDQEALAKKTIEQLFLNGRLFIWGESAIPSFLIIMWALDNLRGDQFADRILFAAIGGLAYQNSKLSNPKLSEPYDSADEALTKNLRRVFEGEKALETHAMSSYTLESLVIIAARRMWRNVLATIWTPITKIDLIKLVPDDPIDLLLWNWGHKRGNNQSRKFPSPQSWNALLNESRRNEDDSLPGVIKDEFDFALLFLLCFPHRLSRALAKHLEDKMRYL